MIKRLLLVEDDAALARILGAALGEEGFSVTLAATGAEGLRLFEAAPPDLAILDVLLPEMDGLELCRRLRRRYTTPIVLLTSRAEEVDRVTGLDLGADDYITKPFSTRELCARIRAIERRLGRGGEAAPAGGRAKEEPPLRVGELLVDRASFTVRWTNSAASAAPVDPRSEQPAESPPPVHVPEAATAVPEPSAAPAEPVAGTGTVDPGARMIDDLIVAAENAEARAVGD